MLPGREPKCPLAATILIALKTINFTQDYHQTMAISNSLVDAGLHSGAIPA